MKRKKSTSKKRKSTAKKPSGGTMRVVKVRGYNVSGHTRKAPKKGK